MHKTSFSCLPFLAFLLECSQIRTLQASQTPMEMCQPRRPYHEHIQQHRLKVNQKQHCGPMALKQHAHLMLTRSFMWCGMMPEHNKSGWHVYALLRCQLRARAWWTSQRDGLDRSPRPEFVATYKNHHPSLSCAGFRHFCKKTSRIFCQGQKA